MLQVLRLRLPCQMRTSQWQPTRRSAAAQTPRTRTAPTRWRSTTVQAAVTTAQVRQSRSQPTHRLQVRPLWTGRQRQRMWSLPARRLLRQPSWCRRQMWMSQRIFQAETVETTTIQAVTAITQADRIAARSTK